MSVHADIGCSAPSRRVLRALIRARSRSMDRPAFARTATHSALAAPARAQSVEEFYRGRTVTILVGFTAGGGYDLYARLLGRHIGRHIPGNPADRGAEHAGRGLA